MENQTKISSECALMKQGSVIPDDNLLLTICGDSVEPSQLVSPGGDSNNLANILNCRLAKNICKETKNDSNLLHKANTLVQLKNNCNFFYLKELRNDTIVATVNKTADEIISRPIAPKTSDSNSNLTNSGKRSLVIESYKKRDDKRRATHNEVERRRRDKMNSWIFKLKELIPESAGANSPTDSKTKGNGTDSKSQILIRACEYIKEMQEELKSLRECLMENGNLYSSNNQPLRERDELKTMSPQPTYEVEIKSEPSMEEIKVVKYEV